MTLLSMQKKVVLREDGATQRLGAVFHAVTRPFEWMVGSLSFTYVDATLLEPPPPTAEEPQPPFIEGQNFTFRSTYCRSC